VTNIEILIAQVPGLQRPDLERWISNEWVRPDGHSGHYDFCEIDVARVRLIRDLRDEMEVNEEALPIVLSLLDQLYDLRRRMREISDAIGKTVPEEVLQNLVAHLAKRRL
jgi:chaperone modulatory protein CbpM